MATRDRTMIGVGVALGLLLALIAALWWQRRGPSEAEVRRTVITTVQEESPASFLVTGTLDIQATVAIDSSAFLTPGWLTTLLQVAQPTALPLLRGGAQTRVRVPGRVSYGFDVRQLRPSMVRVAGDNVVEIELPELSVHSVEPDLPRLEVRTSTEGWMRVFSSQANRQVRKKALSGVEAAFRAQARRRLNTATQPRVNTARALEAMLRPALTAVGVGSPQFRIQVGDRLVLQPETE